MYTVEAEFGAAAIASQNNLRMGRTLHSFGGTIFTRANRTDINHLEDIKDRIVEVIFAQNKYITSQ
jgi:hypothetical protein